MTQLRTIDLPPVAQPSLDDLRTHREPLTGRSALTARLKHILTLSGVARIEITPEYLQVDRVVRAGNEIAPVDPDEGLNPAGVLSSLDLQEVGGAHALLCVQAAVEYLAALKLRVSGVIAPNPQLVAAFLGLDAPPETFLGHRIWYTDDPEGDRLTVVGGPTSWLDDATHGVIIDPFLMLEQTTEATETPDEAQ